MWGMAMSDDPLIPKWCIDRAKDVAPTGDPWFPYLNLVMRENEMMYGDPLPERDPEKEARRRRAVKHQRVLAPERFSDPDEVDR